MTSRGIPLVLSARTRKGFTLFWAALFVLSLLLQYASIAAPRNVLAGSLNVNLDQWANKPGQGWQNGNLNGNNSAYAEGNVVPFRLAIEGLTAGQHTIHINYDFTAGGHKAYDFLATWNVTETPDPCATGGGGVSSLCSPSLPIPDTKPFPSDTFSTDGLTVSGAETFAGIGRNLTMYGGTIVSIAGPTHNGSAGGNSTGDFLVTFTTTGSAAFFLWGGHLAQSSYWNVASGGTGDPDGAALISGAPWHMRTQQLDNSGNKNQDRSIQPSALGQSDVAVTTTLNGADQTGTHITVPAGTQVTDSAVLSVAFLDKLKGIGGSVTYAVFSDSNCQILFADAGTKTVKDGVVPNSDQVTFTTAGIYYWVASYSGYDHGSTHVPGAQSVCGDEVLTVGKSQTSVTTSLSGADQSGSTISVPIGTSVSDTATISGLTEDASGTVDFSVYDNPNCSGDPIWTSTDNAVLNGAATSGSHTFSSAGTFYWLATYSGDANNASSTSVCGDEVLTVFIPGQPSLTIDKLVNGAKSVTLVGGSSGSLSYTITVTNNGDAASDPTHVVDTNFPSFFSESNTTCTRNDSLFSCTFGDLVGAGINLGSLAPDEVVVITVSGTASPNTTTDVSASPHVNTALLCPGSVSEVVLDLVQEEGNGCDSSSASVTVGFTPPPPPPAPSMTIAKTNGTTGAVTPGTAVSFTLTIGVQNATSIANTTIVDQLPAGIGSATAISNGGVYDPTTNKITWSSLTVTNGTQLTYTATVSGTASPGTYVNTATITQGPCALTCSASSTVSVEAGQPPAGGVAGATATPRVTPPNTSTTNDGTTSTPGLNLGLILLVLAGVMAGLGVLAPLPARTRRRDCRE